MRNEKNIIRIIVTILLISMIVRICFILMNLNHRCTHNDNCPICELIHKFKYDLNGFNSNAKVIIDILLMFLPVATYINNKIRDKEKDTLVGLKIELRN